MAITGNFNLQTIFSAGVGFGLHENATLFPIESGQRGLSQAHLYIFTSWNPSWNPKTLRDFTGLGRPVLNTTITATVIAWNRFDVIFNITQVNNVANLSSPNISITLASMDTKVAVDYYQNDNQPETFPTTGVNTIVESYSSTGEKTITIDGLERQKRYQYRLRYYNKFNELSLPSTGANFDQGIIPTNGSSFQITTPDYATLPKPEQVIYRISPTDLSEFQVVWDYRNVLPNGGFTSNSGYQPPTYFAQSKFGLNFEDALLIANSQVNWGNTSNFNKGARWIADNNPIDGVRVKAVPGLTDTFNESQYEEATLYQYPTVITNNSTLLSTTSFRVSMTLGNISGYNVVYFWQYRVGTSGAFTDTQTFTVSIGGTYTFDITGLSSNTNYQFRAGVRRETDIFVDTFNVDQTFVFGDLKTQSTDIRPSSITQGLFGTGGDVTLTVSWSHPPAYSNGLPTGGTYTVQILDLALQLVTQVTGIAGTTTFADFTNICSLLSDGDFIKSKVIANIPNIGTGERLADDFIEVSGCATENGGGNGGIGGGL